MLDVLMISHNRLEYLKKAVQGVVAQDYPLALTIWDNNSNDDVKEYLASLDKSIKIVYNGTNDSLASITSKIFSESNAEFVGKVDSDTIVPPNWASRLIDAHTKYDFGFIGGFHFRPEDLCEIEPNIEDFNGIKLWRKHHIGGCSFIIRRKHFKPYQGNGIMGLSEYQAEMGLVNGYLWNPVLWVEHMEDGRSPHCIKTQEYQDYKLLTRGLTIEQYTHGIPNKNYLLENAKEKNHEH